MTQIPLEHLPRTRDGGGPKLWKLNKRPKTPQLRDPAALLRRCRTLRRHRLARKRSIRARVNLTMYQSLRQFRGRRVTWDHRVASRALERRPVVLPSTQTTGGEGGLKEHRQDWLGKVGSRIRWTLHSRTTPPLRHCLRSVRSEGVSRLTIAFGFGILGVLPNLMVPRNDATT